MSLSRMLLEGPANHFEELSRDLRPSIIGQVASFSKDPMLKRVEDKESLMNIALMKLYEATLNFEYDHSLSEVHNEARFMAMVKRYIRNEMIDRQYHHNVESRKPKKALLSIHGLKFSDSSPNAEDDDSIDIESPQCDAYEICNAREFDTYMRNNLSGDEKNIYGLLVQGYSPEPIAGKLGLEASRVRYILYRKIQPKAQHYIDAK